VKRVAIGATIAGGVLVVALAGGAASGLFARPDAGGEPRIFAVEPGEPLGSVVSRLHEAGLLPRRPLFGPRVLLLFARLSGADREIKAGEYEISPGRSPLEILSKMRSGEIRTLAVTLPEGLRLDEVSTRLEQAGIVEAAVVRELATDPEFADSLGIEGETLEGYLYPETYRFRRGTPAEEVLRTLVREFRDRWTEEDERKLAESGFRLHEVVTLASVIEKETAAAEERTLISAVFRNRLKRGMRLQSDPTVIYGIVHTRGAFDGNIRKRDLLEDNPYNTYTRAGLPAGPIANPTIESIRASLDPADVGYLYFVSRNDGTHVSPERPAPAPAPRASGSSRR
jgi:UPF0755 protein